MVSNTASQQPGNRWLAYSGGHAIPRPVTNVANPANPFSSAWSASTQKEVVQDGENSSSKTPSRATIWDAVESSPREVVDCAVDNHNDPLIQTPTATKSRLAPHRATPIDTKNKSFEIESPSNFLFSKEGQQPSFVLSSTWAPSQINEPTTSQIKDAVISQIKDSDASLSPQFDFCERYWQLQAELRQRCTAINQDLLRGPTTLSISNRDIKVLQQQVNSLQSDNNQTKQSLNTLEAEIRDLVCSARLNGENSPLLPANVEAMISSAETRLDAHLTQMVEQRCSEIEARVVASISKQDGTPDSRSRITALENAYKQMDMKNRVATSDIHGRLGNLGQDLALVRDQAQRKADKIVQISAEHAVAMKSMVDKMQGLSVAASNNSPESGVPGDITKASAEHYEILKVKLAKLKAELSFSMAKLEARVVALEADAAIRAESEDYLFNRRAQMFQPSMQG